MTQDEVIYCQVSLDLKDEAFFCEKPAGHEGPHQESGYTTHNGKPALIWIMKWTTPDAAKEHAA